MFSWRSRFEPSGRLRVVQVHHDEALAGRSLWANEASSSSSPSAVRSSWPDASRCAVSRHTPEALVAADRVDHGAQLGDSSRPWCRPRRRCSRAAGAPWSRRPRSRARSQRLAHAREAGLEARALVRADVRDDRLDAELLGGRDRSDQGDHRLLVELLVHRRQVDQVDGVDDREAQIARRRARRESAPRRRRGTVCGFQVRGLPAKNWIACTPSASPRSMAVHTPPLAFTCAPKYIAPPALSSRFSRRR